MQLPTEDAGKLCFTFGELSRRSDLGVLEGDTGSEATETDRRIMGRETTLGPSRFNVSMLTATCAMYFNGKDKDHRVLTSRKQ